HLRDPYPRTVDGSTGRGLGVVDQAVLTALGSVGVLLKDPLGGPWGVIPRRLTPKHVILRYYEICKEGELIPRYVGQYQISKRVGKVAYELDLPSELDSVHPVLQVSMLKKCVRDPASIIPLEGLGV
ncbi:hypothetical protein MTR67_018176, partial [Solanum verrucosum]